MEPDLEPLPTAQESLRRSSKRQSKRRSKRRSKRLSQFTPEEDVELLRKRLNKKDGKPGRKAHKRSSRRTLLSGTAIDSVINPFEVDEVRETPTPTALFFFFWGPCRGDCESPAITFSSSQLSNRHRRSHT